MTKAGELHDQLLEDKRIEGEIKWRLTQTLALGTSYKLATEFAESRISVSEITSLVKRGCPPDLAVRILL